MAARRALAGEVLTADKRQQLLVVTLVCSSKGC